MNEGSGQDIHEEQCGHNPGTGPVLEDKKTSTKRKTPVYPHTPQAPMRQQSKTQRTKPPATTTAIHEKHIREFMKLMRSGKPMPAPDSTDNDDDTTDHDGQGVDELTKKIEKLDMTDVADIRADMKAVETQLMLMPKDDGALLAKALLGVDLTDVYPPLRVAKVCLQHRPRACAWLLIGSPPCAMFSSLQNSSLAKHQHDPEWVRTFAPAVAEAKRHTSCVCGLYHKQIQANMHFMHEHRENLRPTPVYLPIFLLYTPPLSARAFFLGGGRQDIQSHLLPVVF